MPVPPTTDLLATISMFEQQIKSEPLTYYSTCPPGQETQNSHHDLQQQQQGQQSGQQQQPSVISAIDNKNNVLHSQILLRVRQQAQMFWIERLREGDTFCICESGWLEMRFTDVLFYTEGMKLLVQPEHGVECKLFHIRNGESLSHIHSFRLQFESMQHVRFRLLGGQLTLSGMITPHSNALKRREGEYPSLCPFGDAELLNTPQKFKKNKEKNERAQDLFQLNVS